MTTSLGNKLILTQIIHNIINNLRFAESLSEPLQQIVRLSYLNAFQFLPGKS